MIKFVSLFSGSSGNSYFLQVDDNKFLIDVGVSHKKIVEALKTIGEDIKDIQAIFISHEHTDHIRGLPIINKNYDIPIYINKKTLNKVSNNIKQLNTENISFFTNKKFVVEETKVVPFSVPHDAVDPVGFSFFDKNNKKISIVTDLGEITEEVYKHVSSADLLVLEANYDEELIRYSNYPLSLVNRIMSSDGHLPNSESLDLVLDLVDKGLKHIALAHVSRSNNNFELVSQMFENSINNNKSKEEKVNIHVLRHNMHSEEIIIEK